MAIFIDPGLTSAHMNNTIERQLSWDQLHLKFESLFSTAHQIDPPASLVLSLNEMKRRAVSSEIPSRNLNEFSLGKQKENLLRIVTEKVPDGILPKQYTATLYDIKVSSRGPDDKVYNANPDIRKFIPRGTTLMSIEGNEEQENNLDVVVYANRKFTGGIGDEDESQPETDDIWRSYCLDNPDQADMIVAMDKLNGEAAHLAGRFIDGMFYIITGSKNVHMIIRSEEDIEKYQGSRYHYAKIIAGAVWNTLVKMPENNRQVIFNLLHHTKCTLMCEILIPENQHIVNLSDLKSPTLNVLTITPTVSDEADRSLTALPPHHCLDLFAALGFTTAPYKIINTKDVRKFIQDSRNGVEKEGHVLYYLKQSNGYENTIGMAKTKTIWYVLLRALREKAVFAFTAAKKRDGWSLQDRIKATHKRFNEIQSWLKFNSELLIKWKKLSEEFLLWLNKEINTNHITSDVIRPQFPILWNRFFKNPENQL